MKHTKLTKLTAAVLSCALLLGGCGSVDSSKTVMTVGDVGVTAGVYEFYLNSYKKSLDDETAKQMAQDQCEANHQIIAVAKAMGIEFDEETQQKIADYKQQVVDSYDGGYEDFLKENNLTDADIDTIISVTYYAEELQKKMGEKEFTDEEKREYFKENYRRAKHILISTKDMTTNEDLPEDKQAEAKAKAEELLERAKNGEDFDALVSEYSEDPGSKSNPDGYVFTDNEMVPEFQDGVDSLKPGEFTLVKSSYGYHVIERLALDETPELFEKEYTNAADSLAKKMENNRFKEQVYAWVDEYGISTEVDQKAIDKVTEQNEDK